MYDDANIVQQERLASRQWYVQESASVSMYVQVLRNGLTAILVLFKQLRGYGGKPQTNHPSSMVNRIRQGYRDPHGQHPTHKRTVETNTPSHRLGIGSECYHGGTDEFSSSDQ